MPEHVCPWWLGYLLASPFRRFFQKPEEIVSPYLVEEMTVLEVGPGMGFFTLPMAKLVGERGKIICVDVQERMIKGLARRAGRAGLSDRIIARVAPGDSLNIEEFADRIDFALLFAVVHEIPNQENLFHELRAVLKESSLALLSEPAGHVTSDKFNLTLEIAARAGFGVVASPEIKRSHTALLGKLHSQQSLPLRI